MIKIGHMLCYAYNVYKNRYCSKFLHIAYFWIPFP